jgi:hypothetical protein
VVGAVVLAQGEVWVAAVAMAVSTDAPAGAFGIDV